MHPTGMHSCFVIYLSRNIPFPKTVYYIYLIESAPYHYVHYCLTVLTVFIYKVLPLLSFSTEGHIVTE